MTKLPVSLAETIVEHMRGYAVITLTADGRVTEWLGDAEAITGFAREEAIGMDLERLYPSADVAVGLARMEIELALKEGRVEDSRWHCRKDGVRFWANGLTLPLNGGDSAVMKIFRDETPLRRADEQRVLLLNELNHRVKNTLATVQSVADQTLRTAGVDAAVRETLTARLIALSRAHNVLTDQNWAGADLEVIVRDVTGPHDRDPSPFRIDGPMVRLHPSQAVTLSLVIHELATNAVKYGALSTPDGEVTISWNTGVDAMGVRQLNLLWREAGGPPVCAPIRRGFGSRLIRSAFADHDGEAAMHFEPDGLCCVLGLRLIDDADGSSVNGKGPDDFSPDPSDPSD